MATGVTPRLWAPAAWVDGGWRDQVLIEVDDRGRIAALRLGVEAPLDAHRLPGAVLPGLVDAHSHAFQRAFAGLAQRRSAGHDDFWSWRDAMYAVAGRIDAQTLRAIATQLFVELLEGGYTQVCEFHYLHHARPESPQLEPLVLARAVAEAAVEAGIGLTLLPALYERQGFDQQGLRPEQRRFASSVDEVIAWRDAIRRWRLHEVDAGVAVHSLRAASADSIRTLAARVAGDRGPIHIHVAEQTGEVDACLAATRRRPVQWLCDEIPLDARWQLVHATHVTRDEIAAVARLGAGVVLCPSTEADLGDGLTDLDGWLDAGVPISVGSDSQASRSPMTELRWLELGQRLAHRRRNLAARPELGVDSTAALLFDRVLQGGAAAAGWDSAGLRPGARADLLVVEPEAQGIAGAPASHRLDALVFATDAPAFREVWVAGRQRVHEGRHLRRHPVARDFVEAMHALQR